MSANAIERALWQALSDPKDLQVLREDAGKYYERFAISENERHWLLSWDVAAIASHGVNQPLLMMAFTALNGRERRPEYLAKLNGTWKG